MTGASNGASSCLVSSWNSSTVTLIYFNQTSTILTSAKNLYPNSNELEVIMYTAANELVERGKAVVTPTIEYNELTVSGTVSTTTVATNTDITIDITSHHELASGATIVVQVPIGIWSAAPEIVNKSCSYLQQANTYSTCVWNIDGAWVREVNVSLTHDVPINTTIRVMLTVTNAWSAVSLTSHTLSFLVANSLGTYVSQGRLTLQTLYGSSSFQAIPIGNIQTTQSTPEADQPNTLTLTFNLSVPIALTSLLHLTIPKEMYSFPSLTSGISNYQLSS